MKRIMVMTALAVGMFTVTYAQDRRAASVEQRADRQATLMQERLRLSAEQRKAVYELNLAEMHKIREAKNDNREAFQAMRKEREEKMKAILTPEQAAKWEKMKTERTKNSNDRAGKPGPATGK